MLELPDVTLCCIDTANPELALRALRLSSADIRFARPLFLTDRRHEIAGLDVRAIPKLASPAEYSELVLRELVHHIDTAHVLLIQWDGSVIHPDALRLQFPACD